MTTWHTDTVRTGCPYCGEAIDIVVDLSVDEQSYIEDCSVCCRPITFSVAVDGAGDPAVWAARDDD